MVSKSVQPFNSNGKMQVTMRNISAPVRNIPHGLMNAPSVHLSVLQSGYDNPAHQLAKNKMKLSVIPNKSVPNHNFNYVYTLKPSRSCVNDFSKLRHRSVDEQLASLL